jgi:tetratricopeptide (TPR) repeat protein
MQTRSSIQPFVFRLASAVLVAGVVAVTSALPATAQGQPTPPVADRIDLVGLTTRQPSPDAPSSQVQFQATVNYRLQSMDRASVLLFLFENNSEDSTQQSSQGIPIQRGTGQLILNIDYTLRPDVRTLTLVAGLFKAQQKLLAWVSTNPIDMGPWPGRVAFEKAMAARLDSDFATAEQDLTQAIAEAADTGNYYYWRGDTRIRMNNFGDALADFDRSLELMPRDRPSRVGRGIAHLWLGQAQAAADDLSLAIDGNATPDRVTAWAYRARGIAQATLGLSDAAIADYKAYLALAPDAADRAQIEGWISDLSG